MQYRGVFLVFFLSQFLLGCLGEGFKSSDSIDSGSGDESGNPSLTLGIESYSNNCMMCHGVIGSSNKRNSSVSSIQGAIQSVPQMSFLSTLSSNEINAIELALRDEVQTPPFYISSPAENENVSSSFVITGNCIQGSTINLAGSFGEQTFSCSGSFSFLVSSNQSGQRSFSITQELGGAIEVLNRSVNYIVGFGLSETVTSELAGMCSQEGEDVSHSPVRRLSKAQYINSLKPFVRNWAGFYGLAKPNFDSIPDDVVTDSISTYLRYTRANVDISFEHILAYHNVATALVDFVTLTATDVRFIYANNVENISNLNCWFYNNTGEACSDALIVSLGRRFFSRPLTSAELLEAEAVYDAETEQVEGVRSLIYYFMMSPEFLFQLEVESTPVNDILNLTQYELANKISLQLTNSIADNHMLGLARDGLLTSSLEISQAVDYLINTYPQEVRDTYWEFVSEWLGKTKYEEFPYSNKLNGMVSSLFDINTEGGLVREGMKEDLRNMFEHYTFNSAGSFSDVLTNNNSFITEPLVANIHGVNVWDRNPASIISYAPNSKKGFLTSSALITQGGSSNNPFHMGGTVYKHVLCKQFGDTPAPEDLDPGEPSGNLTTTRDHFASLTPNGSSCMNCHSQINPLGFSFEEFDFLGRKRNGFERFFDESGNYIDQLQVDSTASVNLSDQDIGIDGALDLIDKIDQSKEAHVCFAKQYFRFSQARLDTEKDSCTIQRAFEVSKNGSILDIMKAIVSDPNFAKRRIEE